ncbi:MAG: hypothetical protein IPO52_03315 [Gemmatimonadetes bacterium]|nr:hypothetical protein [Gemmatimonadota bacterium]
MTTFRVAIAVLLACAPIPALSQAPPIWSVSAKPTVTIGVTEGELEYEFAGVTGVRRLANGMIVVANTKPLELRLFDAKGKFVRRIGRSGNGPGEFRGDLRFAHAGGDSIVVFVSGRARTIVFAIDGTLLGETLYTGTITPMLASSTLTHRTFVWAGGGSVTACVRPVLDALPVEKNPALRDLYADPAGRAWVREFGSRQYTVYSPMARVLGRVVLPNGFEPIHIGANFIAGVGRLDDDVEQVQVWGLTAPAPGPRPACLTKSDSFPPPKSPRVAEMKSLLRNAATALEAGFAQQKRYIGNVDSLQLEVPSDIAYRTLRVTAGGWAIAVFDRKSSLVCTMSIGDGTPAGWPDGVIRCGG